MTNQGLVLTLAVMPILTASTVGIGGVWLTGDLRVFGLVWLIAAIVGAGLVGTSAGARGFCARSWMRMSGVRRREGL